MWTDKTGLDYEERYQKYEQQYDEHNKYCMQRKLTPPTKIRYKAGFAAIKATKSIANQMKELDRMRVEGLVRISRGIYSTPKNCRGEFAWGTDVVELVPAKTLVCYQAALVHATSSPLSELGKHTRSNPRRVLTTEYRFLVCRYLQGAVSTRPVRLRSACELQGLVGDALEISILPSEAIGCTRRLRCRVSSTGRRVHPALRGHAPRGLRLGLR